MEYSTKTKDVTESQIDAMYPNNPDLTRASKDLFEVLCQLTGGKQKSC